MLTPPSGTVTFLFTDIEGSTQLSQKHPAEFPQALARHHEILRQAIEAAQGYVFQVVGDSFCAAFTTAREAISAALNAQRSLQREKWQTIREIRVRMGVHTGAAVWQRDKYEGYLTLAHVQRLMSAGHGGQILLSQTTYNLVRDELPADVSTRDMGERRLRDVERTERIYQLAAPDLPAHFPSLRTSETRPNNLPVQTTSFVGREQAFAEVKQLLSATSLLTLTGAGGSGKTRLALEVAADMLDSFAKGVWLVELAPLTDPLLIPHEVANVLSLRVDERQPVLDSLIDYLREKELLIVLDNCEHLIEACAQFATDMLRSCPRVKIMASSREVLGIAGETTYRVPTLNTPDPAHLPSLQALNQYDAVKLFSARASAARPGFKITSRNALAVAQICHQLDGIPLAIELAAARVKALSVEQIAARLDDRFRLLSGGSRATLPRQQTLRALIDWSYDLLLDAERVLLHRLSVFVDGCSLEAAEAVCSDAPTAQRADANSAPALAPEDVMDLLIHLVD